MYFANGLKAKAICDVCGLAVPYGSLRALVVNLMQTNVRACRECWTPDHPQLQAGKNVPVDAQQLRDPRPERRHENITNIRWHWNPVYALEAQSQLGAVSVVVTEAA